MNRNTRLLLKNARKVKWRRVNSTSDLIERDSFAHSRREIRLCCFSTLSVFSIRPFSSRLAFDSTMHKRRLEHISDKLQRCNIGPQWFERIHVRAFESLHQLAMTPEDVWFTGSSEEPERLIGMFID